jgi:dTDP-4-dehydrorhamnose 3,5-epimerase
VFDVAVDIRVGSPTFGRWVSVVLSGKTKRQIWVPAGFAHGFCVTSETALVLYKCTALYDPAADAGIRYDDPDLKIAWPIAEPTLSEKDRRHPRLSDLPRERLFRFEK